MSNEPHITINGVSLDQGQSMAVRVAVTSFFDQMGEPDALGDDEGGRALAAAYRKRIEEVLRLILPARG